MMNEIKQDVITERYIPEKNSNLLERDDWVDYAKALGIILVVYGHTARGVLNAGIKYDKKIHYLIDSIIYSFHMPLFFFLSGLFFVSSLKKRGPYPLFKNKLETIFYPYIVWSLLQGGIELILSRYTNGNVTLTGIASLLWAPRAQFWFLYALFLISVIGIAVYVKLPIKYYGLVFLLAALVYISRREFLFIPLTGFILSNFVFFALGVIFYQKRKFVVNYNHLILPITFLLFISFQWYFHIEWGFSYKTKEYGLALLLAICSLFFVSSFCIALSRFKLTWLSFVGAASLGIYVMHILAGSGTRIILQKFLGIDSAWIHLLIETVMGVLIPLMIMTFFKNTIEILLKPPAIFRK